MGRIGGTARYGRLSVAEVGEIAGNVAPSRTPQPQSGATGKPADAGAAPFREAGTAAE